MSKTSVKTEYRVILEHEDGVTERASCKTAKEARKVAHMLKERSWNTNDKDPLIQSRAVHYECWKDVETI